MHKIPFRVYCFIIVVIVFAPLVGTLAGCVVSQLWPQAFFEERELSGVVVVPAKPSFSIENFADGTFQSGLEEYVEYNLFARRTLTRLYNQLLYTLFHSTDNQEMLVGKENYVYEKAYATAYLTEMTEAEKAALEYNINRLALLSEKLEEQGIPLVIRMSPSKAELYPEYLPSAYDRFVKMKQNGLYHANWYQTFCELIAEKDIPVYDRHDMMVAMKADGEIVFTKGGTHWSLAPMSEYINGLNALLEKVLNRKLGRMIVTDEKNVVGEMGNVNDSDIWDICWNALCVKPNYASPHRTFKSVSVENPLCVFTIGQSFSTLPLSTIYCVDDPVWDKTYFSWYNSRVIHYTEQNRTGVQISEKTDDYETYLATDVILVEFLENGTGWTQFEFVNNLLEYLEKREGNL